MHEQRYRFQVLPRGAVHTLPALHLRCTRLHHGLCLRGLSTAWMGRLTRAEALLSLTHGLTRLSQTAQHGPCIALHQLMDEVEHLRDTQTPQAGFGEFHARL